MANPIGELPLIGIAVSGGKSTKSIVDWALEKFGAEDKVIFELFHVRPKSIRVPTELGNKMPISGVREEIAQACRTEMEMKAYKMLRPFITTCNRKNVKAEIVIVESDDVPSAIAVEIARSGIKSLVIGNPYRLLTRKSRKLSAIISSAAPPFCTVYAISNGKVSFIRPADVDCDSGVHSPVEISSPVTDAASCSVPSFPRQGTSSSSFGCDSIFVPPPAHFICPILEDLMIEPCVAADGYTYDRGAMSRWLQNNDTSFVTGSRLGSKDLWPNYTLQAAIDEWRTENLG